MAIRIATFNMENLSDGAPGMAPIEARAPTLRAQIARLDADILCLQEINSQAKGKDRVLAALDTVLGGTPYAAYHRCSTLNPDGTRPLDIHNLVILSRYPIRAVRQIHHGLVPTPIHRLISPTSDSSIDMAIRWDRPLLCAVLELDAARLLHVIDLHLRAPLASFIAGEKLGSATWKSVHGWAEGYYVAEIKRSGQALETRLLLDRIFDGDPTALVAVCGDFNAEANDTPVRIVCGDPRDVGNPALADRSLAALGAGTDQRAMHTVIHDGRFATPDHILVSRTLAIRCRGVTVDNAALLEETEPAVLSARRLGSYHAPVVAEFELPE